MSEIFIYNIEGEKAIKLKLLCRKLNLNYKVIEKDEFGYKLGYLLGLSDDSSKAENSDFNGEMLYLVDLAGAVFDIFLHQLKRQKIPVELKAVKTDTNIGYTSAELFSEISAERSALEKGETAHKS